MAEMIIHILICTDQDQYDVPVAAGFDKGVVETEMACFAHGHMTNLYWDISTLKIVDVKFVGGDIDAI